jgi:hypothetical protein
MFFSVKKAFQKTNLFLVSLLQSMTTRSRRKTKEYSDTIGIT